MSGIIEWLSGRKSYLLLIVGFVFNLGVLAAWWPVDSETWTLIDSLLLALLGASFRAAITKSSPTQ